MTNSYFVIHNAQDDTYACRTEKSGWCYTALIDGATRFPTEIQAYAILGAYYDAKQAQVVRREFPAEVRA